MNVDKIAEVPVLEQGSGLQDEKKSELVKILLNEVDFTGCAIWGHGTTDRAIAEKILEEGILVNPGYSLTEIASPMTSAETSEMKAEEVIDQAYAWKHKRAKYVVLISIPDGARMNNVVESATKDGKNRTHLPPRFIRGYVNALDGVFISNPSFEKNSEPTRGLFPNTVRLPIPKRDRADTNVQVVASDDSDIPEIWK